MCKGGRIHHANTAGVAAQRRGESGRGGGKGAAGPRAHAGELLGSSGGTTYSRTARDHRVPVGEGRLNDRSLLRRFFKVSRDFGFVTAMRVACSKVRGWLCPALALPDAPVYNARRQLSVLLSTAEQGAATLDAVVEVLAGRGVLDWEVCICERFPVEPEIALALARFRGTQPWIRIVTADGSVDDATAARWTVEQATGQFVALVAPGYMPEADAIVRLLTRLHNDSRIDAAVLAGTDSGSGSPPSSIRWADCRLLLQRKSGYLAALPGRWPMTAPALAKALDEAGVPTGYLAARESEVLD